jgi:Xaa-Pro aminopeptidase
MQSMKECVERRKLLMQKIGANGIFILPAAALVTRNADTHYPFRQHSDFYYLSGFSEPDAILVLAPHRKQGEYILFTRPSDSDAERWDGARAGIDGALNTYLADQAFPMSEFKAMLPELLLDREHIHYALGSNPAFDEMLIQGVNSLRSKIRGGAHPPIAFVDIISSLHEMRLLKSKTEINLMKKAADITVKGHMRAMQACRPGQYEYELEAILNYEFMRHGARATAYPSIVGAGKNSCVLHYIRNQDRIQENDLILIDAAAEYENYAADVTRTFPANGHFSSEQAAIYNVVLKAQLQAIESIKPGISFMRAQHIIVEIITQGLIDLGILKGTLKQLLEERAYLPFYMHRSGHWLGLDVHDVGCYQINDQWRPLEAGMVLTVEPGIYIAADAQIDSRWHNIGVRIEDDLLVTAQGHEVLTQALPKTIADIEALMAA